MQEIGKFSYFYTKNLCICVCVCVCVCFKYKIVHSVTKFSTKSTFPARRSKFRNPNLEKFYLNKNKTINKTQLLNVIIDRGSFHGQKYPEKYSFIVGQNLKI